jgi:predicted XRE-type DNA-binding protein
MAKRKANKLRIEPGAAFLGLKGMAPVVTVERSSGNVFADLGLPDAVELDTKVRLAVAINQRIDAREWTQTRVASVLGINQPKVSALKHYKLEGFSVERLMGFLTALGSDIEIRIRAPKRSSSTPGRISVAAA